MKPGRVGLLYALCALLLPLLVAGPCTAQEIAVASLDVNVRGSVFELNVHASFPTDDKIREVLASGATVNVRLEAVLDKKQRYWFDERLVDLTLRRALSWNALSQRYVLQEMTPTGPSQQQAFASLEEALTAAGTVENWPLEYSDPRDPDATYQIGVQAGMRIGNMSKTLRALTFWTRYWNHRSEWKSWVLPR
ncbi:MAG: DUF4390 domain-containing protein [Pseudomonadota bacterium]